MKDAPPHQARAAGIQADPTLQPDRPVNPITATLAALFGVVILTLVLYGLNVSSDRPEMASNSSPAQVEQPAAASGNAAANNTADKSKPDTGQAKQQAAGATQQGNGGNASNPPGATKAQPQSTTASQAPASQAPAGQPASDTPNAAAPAKPDG